MTALRLDSWPPNANIRRGAARRLYENRPGASTAPSEASANGPRCAGEPGARSGGQSDTLLATPARPRAEGGGELRSQHEDDARVVGDHAEGHQGAERPVDLVVQAEGEDVPAEELLGRLPEHARQERPGQRRARGHLTMGEVAVGDEENRG